MEFVYLLILDIILLLVIILLFFLFLKQILEFVNVRIQCLRKFVLENDGFFSIFFIALFAAEQVLLIWLIYKFNNNPSILTLIVSIFALVVITTASLQKFLLETKRKYEKETKDSLQRSTKIINEFKAFSKCLIWELRKKYLKKE